MMNTKMVTLILFRFNHETQSTFFTANRPMSNSKLSELWWNYCIKRNLIVDEGVVDGQRKITVSPYLFFEGKYESRTLECFEGDRASMFWWYMTCQNNSTIMVTSFPESSIRYEVEELEDWDEAANLIKPLHFGRNYDVSIIPPVDGAACRFVVSYGKKSVSVYLDTCGSLAADEKEPYYEILRPDGETERFRGYDSVKDLETRIHEVLAPDTDEDALELFVASSIKKEGLYDSE